MKNPLTISFDIGHSSIGWAVLDQNRPHPEIKGCGSVIFPKDDCLASARRGHRRTRRNIRSTRQRIERIKQLFLHLNLLTEEELNDFHHSSPYALAAKAMKEDRPTLSWSELWKIIRWYAHNRGYDGNSRWSRQDDDDDGDTEKEKAAIELMTKHGTSTMAETICAELEIDLTTKKASSHIPYKTLNAAFPRHIVRNEILNLLEKHKGHLPHLDDHFINTLIATDENKGKQAWATIKVPSIKLPRRYFGGLLFGQLIPRFDNRIIATCPISGDKVPNKASLDFLRYRWAMLLANIKSDGKPLTAEQRQSVNNIMEQKGRLTPTELRKHVEEITGSSNNNIKASFEIHPDSKDALELDPAKAYAESASNIKRNALYPYWKQLNEVIQQRALGRWKKRRPVTLQWMLDQCQKENHDPSALQAEIDKAWEADQKKKKSSYLTRDHLLRKSFAPKPLSGRARYSRKVMNDVYDFVLNTDRHPTEKETADLPAGPIYRSKEILAAERKKSIADLTNNHLIRQRLDILLRLTDDIIENYADGNPANITDVIVEVASDLQTYSGLTAKEMAGELTKRLSHFKAAVKYLEENASDLPITGSLIRKCRIAMDMDWHCPFTGKRYDALDLPKLEREHIIPYADRPTNALSALVLTTSEVNKLKGKRTAFQFIKDMEDDDRFLTPKNYEAFVKKLKVANKDSYPDDYHRQSARKKLLMVEEYEAKDHGFTQGALTQTSHLNRLSARQLESKFIDPKTGEPSVRIHSLPGQVTGEVRKAWNLLGTLAKACPDILYPSIEQLEKEATAKAQKEIKKQLKAGAITEQDAEEIIQAYIDAIPAHDREIAGKTKTKTEIRSITHLHHALDAVTIALTHHYLPGTLPGQRENEKGAIWAAMLKRNKTSEQINLLLRTNMFKRCQKENSDGSYRPDARLLDIPKELKDQLTDRLAEKRVVQHIPADQSGAKLEQNPWRVWKIDGDPTDPKTSVTIRQQTSTVGKDGKREIVHKETVEKAGKLIGLKPGKLSKNQAVLVISTNYGLALDPKPTIIPFHDVHNRIKELTEKNAGKYPRILRNGMLIKIQSGPNKGVWKIFSAMANMRLKIAPAYYPSWDEKRPQAKKLTLAPLIKAGLEILTPPLTGYH